MDLGALRARLPRDPDLGPPVLLLLGTVGMVGSTRHVLDLAHKHGADGWPVAGGLGIGSWLVAGVWEIMAAFSGWEIKRRAGARRAVPTITLVVAVAFVLAANLEGSGLPVLTEDAWRYVVAASPALVFLSAAALVETRQWRMRRARRTAARPAAAVGSSGSSTAPPSRDDGPPAGAVDDTTRDPVEGALRGLDDNARAVYSALLAADPGQTLTPSQIQAATALDRDTAYRATQKLLTAGLVVSPSRGRYALDRIGVVA